MTHVCYECGRWFNVEPEDQDLWIVSETPGPEDPSPKRFREATYIPLCPYDGSTLADSLMTDPTDG